MTPSLLIISIGKINSINTKNISIPEDLSEKCQEDLNCIVSASSNLLELVNGILDISKIEANKIEIVNKEYDFEVHDQVDKN